MEQFLGKISTNSILVLVMIALEVICVPLFLHFYWPKRTYKSFTMKTVSSIIFILCGFFSVQLCYALNNDYFHGEGFNFFGFTGDMLDYPRYILLGLVFGMLGDVLLHKLKGTNLSFTGGMALFLAGHIFYIKAFDIAKGDYSWDVAETTGNVILGVGIAFVVVLLALAFIFKKAKGKEVVVAAAAVYGVVLFTMLSKAIEFAMTVYEHYEPVGMDSIWGNEFIKNKPEWMLKGQELFGGEAWQIAAVLVVVGSVLFVTSDLLLGFMMAREHGFKKQPKRWLRIINILTYYAAQIVLAVSVIVVPLGFTWVEELYEVLKLY